MIRIAELFLAAIGRFFQTVVLSKLSGAHLGRWLFSFKVLAIVIPVLLLTLIIYFWIALSGPRMKTQPHILTYQTIHSLPPENAVTVQNSLWPIVDSSSLFRSDTFLVKAGKAFYNYYCVFCHGEIGKKTGPVGRSFVPTPPDLSSSKDLRSDSVLIRKMIFGRSHNPLIPYVVSPGNRLAIAKYIKNAKIDEHR